MALAVRIFRRNLSKIIIVWERSQLDPAFVDPPIASIVDEEGRETLLTYSRFKPDNPEKFVKDIDGVVISHLHNKLDPDKGYKIKIAFSNGHVYQEAVQEVMPVSALPVLEPVKPVEIMHIYGFDYRRHAWVPLPVDTKLMIEPSGNV